MDKGDKDGKLLKFLENLCFRRVLPQRICEVGQTAEMAGLSMARNAIAVWVEMTFRGEDKRGILIPPLIDLHHFLSKVYDFSNYFYINHEISDFDENWKIDEGGIIIPVLKGILVVIAKLVDCSGLFLEQVGPKGVYEGKSL